MRNRRKNRMRRVMMKLMRICLVVVMDVKGILFMLCVGSIVVGNVTIRNVWNVARNGWNEVVWVV